MICLINNFNKTNDAFKNLNKLILHNTKITLDVLKYLLT